MPIRKRTMSRLNIRDLPPQLKDLAKNKLEYRRRRSITRMRSMSKLGSMSGMAFTSSRSSAATILLTLDLFAGRSQSFGGSARTLTASDSQASLVTGDTGTGTS
mgnify:CR=1 FL=1